MGDELPERPDGGRGEAVSSLAVWVKRTITANKTVSRKKTKNKGGFFRNFITSFLLFSKNTLLIVINNEIEQKIDKIHAKCDGMRGTAWFPFFNVIMNFLRNNEF